MTSGPTVLAVLASPPRQLLARLNAYYEDGETSPTPPATGTEKGAKKAPVAGGAISRQIVANAAGVFADEVRGHRADGIRTLAMALGHLASLQDVAETAAAHLVDARVPATVASLVAAIMAMRQPPATVWDAPLDEVWTAVGHMASCAAPVAEAVATALFAPCAAFVVHAPTRAFWQARRAALDALRAMWVHAPKARGAYVRDHASTAVPALADELVVAGDVVVQRHVVDVLLRFGRADAGHMRMLVQRWPSVRDIRQTRAHGSDDVARFVDEVNRAQLAQQRSVWTFEVPAVTIGTSDVAQNVDLRFGRFTMSADVPDGSASGRTIMVTIAYTAIRMMQYSKSKRTLLIQLHEPISAAGFEQLYDCTNNDHFIAIALFEDDVNDVCSVIVPFIRDARKQSSDEAAAVARASEIDLEEPLTQSTEGTDGDAGDADNAAPVAAFRVDEDASQPVAMSRPKMSTASTYVGPRKEQLAIEAPPSAAAREPRAASEPPAASKPAAANEPAAATPASRRASKNGTQVSMRRRRAARTNFFSHANRRKSNPPPVTPKPAHAGKENATPAGRSKTTGRRTRRPLSRVNYAENDDGADPYDFAGKGTPLFGRGRLATKTPRQRDADVSSASTSSTRRQLSFEKAQKAPKKETAKAPKKARRAAAKHRPVIVDASSDEEDAAEEPAADDGSDGDGKRPQPAAVVDAEPPRKRKRKAAPAPAPAPAPAAEAPTTQALALPSPQLSASSDDDASVDGLMKALQVLVQKQAKKAKPKALKGAASGAGASTAELEARIGASLAELERMRETTSAELETRFAALEERLVETRQRQKAIVELARREWKTQDATAQRVDTDVQALRKHVQATLAQLVQTGDEEARKLRALVSEATASKRDADRRKRAAKKAKRARLAKLQATFAAQLARLDSDGEEDVSE